MTRSTLHFVSLLLPFLLPSPSNSEIRTFEGPLEAAPNYIHYSEGFLVAPGYVDISSLIFTTTDDGKYDAQTRDGDDENPDDEANSKEGGNETNAGDKEEAGDEEAGDEKAGDEKAGDDDDDENEINGADEEGEDGGGRMLDDKSETVVDIVLFHEPKKCSKSKAGCDWTDLGIGASNQMGDLRWCCWEDAVDLGLCKGRPDEWGRLILNRTKFEGHYRSLSISPNGYQQTKVKYGKLEEDNASGKFVLVISNCNPEGRNMTVSGKYVWRSKHGYLPGDLFGALYFFASLAVVYAILFIWYAVFMRVHSESIIPIQTWILVTIGIGFLEVFFKAGDYWVWNEDGTRFWFAMYTGVVFGVAKRAISRCLVVMVSLGWGVIRDTLAQMRKIIILGSFYAVTSAACDIFEIFAVVENQTLGPEKEEELFDVVTILTFIVAGIDVTFYMWILDALSGTMQYLENMNQNVKLQRYLRLRLVLLLSILFAVVWATFGIVNNTMEARMMEQEQEWAVQAVWELNYIMVMTVVAILWRPNATAKEYAFVMELPSIGNDVELETNSNMLETNADVLHEDEDENMDGSTNGTTDNKGLKIDDAVDA